MRKFLGSPGGASRTLLRAAMLFLLVSPAFCHAQGFDCNFDYADPTLATVSPSTWQAGKANNITLTGTNFCAFPGSLTDDLVQLFDSSNGQYMGATNVLVVSNSLITATITPDASYVGGNNTVVVQYVDGGFPSALPVQIVGCAPTLASITPGTWFAGKTYNNVKIVGTGFITKEKATDQCPETAVNITTPDGSKVTLGSVTVDSKQKITIASVSPAAGTPTEQATVTVGTAPNTATSATLATPPQILGNEILCDPSMNCTQEPISTTDDSQPPVQNVVVGQPMILNSLPLPNGITATSTTWTIGGTRIADYKPTTASASVTELTDADLAKDSVTFYWVYAGNPVPVTYQYCVNITGANPVLQCSKTAVADFDVSGPTGGTMSFTPYSPSVSIGDLAACTNKYGSSPAGPYLVYAQGPTGSLCSMRVTARGITFNTPTGYTNTSGGDFLLTQLISSDTENGVVCCNYSAGIDTQYPYSQPFPASDSPPLYLPPTSTDVTRNFTANMFLMWKSNIADSIPVPLGYQTWGFSGSAKCSKKCDKAGNWKPSTNGAPGTFGKFEPSDPSQSSIPGTANILVYGLPIWGAVSH